MSERQARTRAGISITDPRGLAIRLARQQPGPIPPGCVGTLRDPASLGAFQRYAMKHGILGLVLNNLRSSGMLDNWDAAAKATVLAPLRVLRQQALMWDMERDRVLGLFHEAGIRPVVLKGGALRPLVYGDSVERPMGDLDLLVERARFNAAIEVLGEGGYTLSWSPETVLHYLGQHFHLRLASGPGFQVELHWALGQPSASWSIDANGFLARSRQVATGTLSMRVPSPEDMLIHMCTQNTEDSFSRLRRLVDIDRIITRCTPDWEAFASLARSSGTEVIAGLSLQLARQLLQTRLPAGLMRDLVPSRTTRTHLALLRPLDGLWSGQGQRYAMGARVMSYWLTTPSRRVSHLRNMIREKDVMAPPPGADWGRSVGSWEVAARFGGFHLLLWSRGLLGVLPLSVMAVPDLWRNSSDFLDLN